PGLRVHRHHEIDAAPPPEIAALVDAHFVPGRQALDVRGEDVARRHRHAHAQDRTGEELVGAGRARAVDVRELDDEIVDRFEALDHGRRRAGPSTWNSTPEDAPRAGSRARRQNGAPPGAIEDRVERIAVPDSLLTAPRPLPSPWHDPMSGYFGTRRPAGRARVGHLEQELLHVPGTGRAALRAQAAMQAHVLVLR